MTDHLFSNMILEVALPLPLRQTFDFTGFDSETDYISERVRVLVPFGTRRLVGIVVKIKSQSDYPKNKLKPIYKVIDTEPIFSGDLWSSLNWLSGYYLGAIGEVFELALPLILRQENDLQPKTIKSWRLTDYGSSAAIDDLAKAPLQLAIFKQFIKQNSLSSTDFRNQSSGWRRAIEALEKKGWLEEYSSEPQLHGQSLLKSDPQTKKVTLNKQQKAASDHIIKALEKSQFTSVLLHGVTGSGKTEIYFEAIDKTVNEGKQVLMLVPEIGLTPQLIHRIEARFTVPVVSLHSRLNKTERHLAWWHARQGNAKIVVGTRSAVFCGFDDLGLIIVDEEHDGSYKQQDGVRYQARDVAIYRAKQREIPILLGSATPSLESYQNALTGRYELLTVSQRATDISLPKVELIDLNRTPVEDGLSPQMISAISETLSLGKQVILFLNRRGYAPVIYCSDCNQVQKCHRCDANLTLHRRANRIRCHHCGYESVAITKCGSCQSSSLVEIGEGTQRVEEVLQLLFPDASCLRIDRDSTRRKGELETSLQLATEGQVDILLGTQLLTKGHDFPNVALVGVLNADQGLYSTDFRASEQLFQQLVQVAGRAGRRDKVGRVLIQTAFPEHAFFSWVKNHDYSGFANDLLAQRKNVQYPPFSFFALLRAESTHQSRALQFLRSAKQTICPMQGVTVMDVVPAPMEKRAGKYRAQLLMCSEKRSSLHNTLSEWLALLAKDVSLKKLAASVRWNLDIDPLDHY